MPDGGRNLVVENTLGGIENDFVRVLTRIRRHENLNPIDRARLCLFTGAMHTRSLRMGEHWRKQQENLHKVVEDLEGRRNLPPKASLRTAKMVENAHLHLIGMGLETEAPLLLQMQMSIIGRLASVDDRDLTRHGQTNSFASSANAVPHLVICYSVVRSPRFYLGDSQFAC